MLGLPKSTLSRRVSKTRLDVRLLQRSTRRLAVTEIGQQFYAHCKAMMAEADTAESVVASTHAEPCGSLNIVCPGPCCMQVADMVASFALRYPLVKLHVSAMNRAGGPHWRWRRYRGSACARCLPDTDLDAQARRKPRSGCASPGADAPSRAARTPQDLANWPAGQRQHVRTYIRHAPDEADRPAGEADLQHWPRLSTTDMHTLRCAAIAGVGVVQLPAAFVQNELTARHAGAAATRLAVAVAEVIHAIFASRRGLFGGISARVPGHLVAGFEVHSTMLAALGKSSGGFSQRMTSFKDAAPSAEIGTGLACNSKPRGVAAFA